VEYIVNPFELKEALPTKFHSDTELSNIRVVVIRLTLRQAMNTHKPIETVYKGYRFRSRLEARWAVYFDKVGALWDYEKEGFNLGGIYYLPDFYVYHPTRFWVEIKSGGRSPNEARSGIAIKRTDSTIFSVATEEELEKCRRLAKATNTMAVMLIGNPYWNDFVPYFFEPKGEEGVDYLCEPNVTEERKVEIARLVFTIHSCTKMPDELDRAYKAARQARFEHGKTG
jgi:hypothetical protein